VNCEIAVYKGYFFLWNQCIQKISRFSLRQIHFLSVEHSLSSRKLLLISPKPLLKLLNSLFVILYTYQCFHICFQVFKQVLTLTTRQIKHYTFWTTNIVDDIRFNTTNITSHLSILIGMFFLKIPNFLAK